MEVETYEKATLMHHEIEFLQEIRKEMQEGNACKIKISKETSFLGFEIVSTAFNEIALPLIEERIATLKKEFEEI